MIEIIGGFILGVLSSYVLLKMTLQNNASQDQQIAFAYMAGILNETDLALCLIHGFKCKNNYIKMLNEHGYNYPTLKLLLEAKNLI
jgi:hypothetical protein